MQVKFEDRNIKIDLYRLFEQMNVDDRKKCAEAITWDAIFEVAIDRMLHKNDDFAGGTDTLMAVKLLSQLETATLSYHWEIISDIRQKIHDIAHHDHLYWKLYHDEIYGNWFKGWAKANGIGSNYDDSTPEFSEFMKEIKDMFEKALKQKEQSDGN